MEEPAKDTFNLLVQLVKHILKCDDEKALSCVAHRLKHIVKQKDALTAVVNDTELAHTSFDASDHADIQKDLNNTKQKTNAAHEFKNSYKEMAKEVQVKLAKAKPAPKKRPRASHEVKTVPLPTGVPTQAEAKEMLPPGAHVWRSLSDEGWCGHLEPFSRTHYSGLVYGPRTACILNIRDMWIKYSMLKGLDIEQCPVKNLWKDLDHQEDEEEEVQPPVE